LTLQPYGTVSTTCPVCDGVLVRPYLTLWNSFAPVRRTREMGAMSDAMLGAATTWNGFLLDCNYTLYLNAPYGGASPVHEGGAKLSYELAELWRGERNDGFGLRPSAAVYGVSRTGHGSGAALCEVGLTPAYRFGFAGQKVGLSVPTVVGLNLGNFYFDESGRNTTAGYFSTGVAASITLPVPPLFGTWYLNASFQYLHLFADNLRAINHDDDNAFVGKIGIGSTY
jgi:hypothetical protein